jgi:hypothetical protein
MAYSGTRVPDGEKKGFPREQNRFSREQNGFSMEENGFSMGSRMINY